MSSAGHCRWVERLATIRAAIEVVVELDLRFGDNTDNTDNTY